MMAASSTPSLLFNGMYGHATKFTISNDIREDGLVPLHQIRIDKPIDAGKEDNIDRIFIDNTNLQSAYNHNDVPIVAYTLDSWKTTFLGVSLFTGVVDILLLPFFRKGGDSVSTILQSFDEKKLLRFNKSDSNISMKYLNNASSAPKVGDTSLVKSDVMGPDVVKIASLPKAIQSILQRVKSDRKNYLVEYTKNKSSSLPIDSPMPILRQTRKSLTKKRSKILTTSKIGKVVALVSGEIKRDKEKTDGLVSIQYLYGNNDEFAPEDGQIRVAYISIEDSKRIINKKKLKRKEWNALLRSMSKEDKLLTLHDVTDKGLAIVETKVEAEIGTIKVDNERVETYERGGKTFADWTIDNNVILNTEAMQQSLATTYGDFGFDRSCSKVNGLCLYKGTNNSSYVRSTPRKDKEDINLSQRHRETFEPLEIPLLNHGINKITNKALMKRKEMDPIMENFNKQVMDKLDQHIETTEQQKKKQKINRITQANNLNSLQILTAGNSKTPGFSIGKHFDRSDAFQKQFNGMAGHVLYEHLKNALQSNDESYIRAVKHMFRCGRLKDSAETEYKYSLYTACGYAAKYSGNKHLSVFFVYDSINTAVNIPMNVVAYNVFNGIWVKHHTSVPFTYDDDFVYLNDPELYVLAWGGGSGEKKTWLQTNHPNINITQPVTFNYFMTLVRDNNIDHDNVTLAGLTGVTQTTITDWLQSHGTV